MTAGLVYLHSTHLTDVLSVYLADAILISVMLAGGLSFNPSYHPPLVLQFPPTYVHAGCDQMLRDNLCRPSADTVLASTHVTHFKNTGFSVPCQTLLMSRILFTFCTYTLTVLQ